MDKTCHRIVCKLKEASRMRRKNLFDYQRCSRQNLHVDVRWEVEIVPCSAWAHF